MKKYKVVFKSKEDGIRNFVVSSQDEPTVYVWADKQRRLLIDFGPKTKVTVEEVK